MNWRGLITVLLLIGALVSGWSVWKQRQPEAAPNGPTGRSDYVLEEFELIALNKQGKESFTLRAPRLARDPNEKTMDIATPLFVIPPREGSNGGPWEVRARNGWVSEDGDELRLRGAVRGTTTSSRDKVRSGTAAKPTTLATDQLIVYPETKRATSPGKVVITQPGSILSGHGLRLNLATRQYSFKSEVRHRYVPTAR